MRDRSMSLVMFAVALYVVMAALATPAVASPAFGGPTTFRGWQLDGTGLLTRGTSGELEPAGWVLPSVSAWDEARSATGYEDQVPELDVRGDHVAQSDSDERYYAYSAGGEF